jgi:adenosylcobalamin-dependent ribonucleoside-triphosphate reductase
MDYSKLVDGIAKNGEPGIIWIDNARNYSRMGCEPDFKDIKAAGVNPCGEQTLESFELCCLVETFPSNHNSFDEFRETLRYAYLYAKSVTLVNTHWNETNAVMGKNRRIGTSQTGIIDAFAKFGRKTMLEWCDKGYKFLRKLDEEYSSFFCVPQSIKITTVKPSGTVSLLAGVSPGIHYPHSQYYIRRIRIAKESELLNILKDAGFFVEDDLYSTHSAVVAFPIEEKNFLRAKNDVSLWEQIANAIDYQHYWSDNQVSITATFKASEIKDIPFVLQFAEDKLKGVSLLPLNEHGYKQAPYEEISKEKFEEMSKNIKPLSFITIQEKGKGEMFCDGDKCVAS